MDNKYKDLNETQLETKLSEAIEREEMYGNMLNKTKKEIKSIRFVLYQKRIDRPFDSRLCDEIDESELEEEREEEE